MNDFSASGDCFDNCFDNLNMILKRCIKTNPVLNWERCHFMVEQGISLVHVVLLSGMKIDKVKIALFLLCIITQICRKFVLSLDM